MSSIEHLKLLELVDTKTEYASILHSFGLSFYRYPEHTLEELCRERSINMPSVIRRLEDAAHYTNFLHLDRWGRLQQGLPLSEAGLHEYPVDIVIAYLKHAHTLFIRHQLPYMADLIANIEIKHFDNEELAKDLKFVFPLFMEDFIHHIYEEEDGVFKYILQLKHLLGKTKGLLSPLFFHLSSHSITDFASHHLEEDDEMEGIRQLTNHYALSPTSSTYTKVIYKALQEFEQSLQIHANIEDNILMPKALRLEAEATDRLKGYASLN